MIRVRRSEERGHANHGWLDTYHTFSFADYQDPRFDNFGALRVINEDFVAPGRGFSTHGHRDMEIVTVVLEGLLEHKDSMGTGSLIRPGEVQLMSAGSGVLHSEFNASEDERLHLLQMWVYPAKNGGAPRYEQRDFSPGQRNNQLLLVVSPDGAADSLTIGQDASLFVGSIDEGAQVDHRTARERMAWLHVTKGAITIGDVQLGAGDGAAIVGEDAIEIAAAATSDFVLWEVARE